MRPSHTMGSRRRRMARQPRAREGKVSCQSLASMSQKEKAPQLACILGCIQVCALYLPSHEGALEPFTNAPMRTGVQPGSAAAAAAARAPSANTSVMTTSTMRRLGLDSPGRSIEQARRSPLTRHSFLAHAHARLLTFTRKARIVDCGVIVRVLCVAG